MSELERAMLEIEQLKDTIFKQSEEIVVLRNENRELQDKLEGKPMTDREAQLLRIAKSIIKEYES